ncbi:hypothetical protein HanRHA438_Chr05g0224111 [Helianthus annuus]|nr:hypothetical protein HanRHA438_Chr05g0224111 [Helianthus annuus]
MNGFGQKKVKDLPDLFKITRSYNLSFSFDGFIKQQLDYTKSTKSPLEKEVKIQPFTVLSNVKLTNIFG